MAEQSGSVIRRTGDEPVFSNGRDNGGMVEVAVSRAAQEVQAAMVVAKKFPRNQTQAHQRILEACKRYRLADAALYEYPRGKDEETGKKNFVTGPSIRLAEVAAQCWGNIDFGITELEQRPGESTVMSYAWDLETNTRQAKVFTVRHERFTRRGSHALHDPRDIYELVANQGARRLRACILGVIPGDIIDSAVAECEKTLDGKNEEPLADRIRKMVSAFAEYSVTQAMIERNLGHSADAMTELELRRMRKIYRTLRDNMASVEDYFGANAPPAAGAEGTRTADQGDKSRTQELAEKFGKKQSEGAPQPPSPQGDAGVNGAGGLAPTIAEAEAALRRASPSAPTGTTKTGDAQADAGTTGATVGAVASHQGASAASIAEPSDQEKAAVGEAELATMLADPAAAEKACREKARDLSNVQRAQFNAGLFKFKHPKGQAERVMSPAEWRSLWDAISKTRFNYDTGIIDPPVA